MNVPELGVVEAAPSDRPDFLRREESGCSIFFFNPKPAESIGGRWQYFSSRWLVSVGVRFGWCIPSFRRIEVLGIQPLRHSGSVHEIRIRSHYKRGR